MDELGGWVGGWVLTSWNDGGQVVSLGVPPDCGHLSFHLENYTALFELLPAHSSISSSSFQARGEQRISNIRLIPSPGFGFDEEEPAPPTSHGKHVVGRIRIPSKGKDAWFAVERGGVGG